MGKLRFREVSNSPQVTHDHVKNKEDYNSDLLLLVFCNTALRKKWIFRLLAVSINNPIAPMSNV